MFILSLVSFLNFYSFILIGLYIIKINPKEKLNRMGAIVNFCFAVWNFAYTFLPMSPTLEEALFWHKISALGWIMFCSFATHFFLILSERTKKSHGIWIYVFIYLLPVILVIKTCFSKESPVAKSFVQSDSGLGWTYVSNIETIWFWLYFIHIIVYFSIAQYLTYKWAKKSNRLRFLKQAKGMIFLNVIMIVIGFITDIVLPVVSHNFPPLFNLVSIFWGVGFLFIVKNYKLLSVDEVATSELILNIAMDPILLLDNKGIVFRCNQATADFLKYKPEEVIGKPLSYYYKSKEYAQGNLHKFFEDKVLRDIEVELVDSQGNSIYAVASFAMAESKLDGFVGVVVSLHNVTEYKKLAETFETLANYDDLTNLPNRRLFDDNLALSIENYRKTGDKFAVVFMDLDGFKSINDCYGHGIGDKLLLEVSNRMFAEIRKKDMLARIGGDEFVLLFRDLIREIDLTTVIDRVKDNFNKPIEIEDKSCKVGISFGISKCPEDGITIEELMKEADARMYDEKSDKHDKY